MRQRQAQDREHMNQNELMRHIMRGDFESCKDLINRGVSVDFVEMEHPLHVAAVSMADDAQAILGLLIGAGANLNAKDSSNNTALHKAAYYANSEATKALLAAGANPCIKNEDGDFPLHLAAAHGHIDVCTALIDAGTPPDQKSESGWTPLDEAASNGQTATCLALVRRAPAFIPKVTALKLRCTWRFSTMPLAPYLP